MIPKPKEGEIYSTLEIEQDLIPVKVKQNYNWKVFVGIILALSLIGNGIIAYGYFTDQLTLSHQVEYLQNESYSRGVTDTLVFSSAWLAQTGNLTLAENTTGTVRPYQVGVCEVCSALIQNLNNQGGK